MTYFCSACQQHVEGDLIHFKEHTEKHIVDLIKHDHPEWVESDGLCRKCYDYYRSEIQGSVFKDAPCALRIRKIKKFAQFIQGIFKR
jgi:hypothetical protein